jgi:class 3 adenylate cyclase/pimeloyl-ACP methyl ester carboxylesterase
MEPHIRYCTSADGTRIAYTLEEGSQPPLLFVASVFFPIAVLGVYTRGSGDEVAGGQRHLRFDRRGVGYSQRDVTDLSLDAQVADVCAVADHAGFSRFDLLGFADGCTIAAAVAARYSERVLRMVLSSPTQMGRNTVSEGIATMARSNWPLVRGTMADLTFGGNADPELRRAFIRCLAETRSADIAAAYFEAILDWDPSPELPLITVPTLVLHSKRRLAIPMEASQTYAAAIPDARLVAVGDWAEDLAYFNPAREFFGHGEASAAPLGEAPVPSIMAVILFADIADSTALTERLGDAAFRAKGRELDKALRSIISELGGTAIDGKLLGDGVLATFPAAAQAIDAALRCGSEGRTQGLPLHLGLHAGDVIREEKNVFGGAVNIASRISALSAPGEVLVSDIVRGLARTSADVLFEDNGEHELKGIAEPQRVFAVRTLD